MHFFIPASNTNAPGRTFMIMLKEFTFLHPSTQRTDAEVMRPRGYRVVYACFLLSSHQPQRWEEWKVDTFTYWKRDPVVRGVCLCLWGFCYLRVFLWAFLTWDLGEILSLISNISKHTVPAFKGWPFNNSGKRPCVHILVPLKSSLLLGLTKWRSLWAWSGMIY